MKIVWVSRRANMKLTKSQLTEVTKTKSKEQPMQWRQVTDTILPYVFIAWHWLNQRLHTSSSDKVYHFMAHLWEQLQRIVNTQNWPFLHYNEQYQLLKWVESMVRLRKITNFNEDWRDGIILCALMEGLAPGVCPRHDLLHPKQEILNLELGLRLAEIHLGIRSDLTPSEILNMEEGMDYKLQQFVAKLRSRRLMHPSRECKLLPRIGQCATVEELSRNPPTCLAKGMGLMMGNKGEKACFNLYLETNEFMDIIIEIDGPEGDYCTKRLTLRSPRKKETFPGTLPLPLTSGRTINIFLEYEMFSNKIAVAYIPPSVGRYKLSIISKGQHIFGSPFTVIVDQERRLPKQKRIFLNPCLPRKESEVNLFQSSTVGTDNISPEDLPWEKVRKRKVIRTIVFRGYANIVLGPGEPLPKDIRAWRAIPGSLVQGTSHKDGQTDNTLQSQLVGSATRQNMTTIQECEITQNSIETLQQNGGATCSLVDAPKEVAEVHQEEMSKSRKNSISDAETADILDVEYQNSTMLLHETDEESNYKNKENLLETNVTSNTLVAPMITVTTDGTHDDSDRHALKNHLMENEDGKIKRRNDDHIYTKSSSSYSHGNIASWNVTKGGSNEQELNIFQSKNKCENELNIEIVDLTPRIEDRQLSNKMGCISSTSSSSTSCRVSENLIQDWANLWNSEGISIVKTRLKEWEHITSNPHP